MVVAGAGEGGGGGKSGGLLGQLVAERIDDGSVVGVDGGLDCLSVKAEGLEGVEADWGGGGSGLHWGGRLPDRSGSELGRGGTEWGRGRSLGGRAVALSGPVADGLDVNVGLGGDLDVDVGLGGGGKVRVLGVGHDWAGLLEGHCGAAGCLVEGVGEGDLGLLDLGRVGDVLGGGSGGADQGKDGLQGGKSKEYMKKRRSICQGIKFTRNFVKILIFFAKSSFRST